MLNVGRIIRPDAPTFAVQCRKLWSAGKGVPAIADELGQTVEAVEAALFTRVRG